ncbi:MAG: hypothetical protein P8X68_17860, partial [Desulfobacterales bacterium]
MVEIFQDETSRQFVKPGIFPQKPIAFNTGVQLILDQYDKEVKRPPITLNIKWYFYVSTAVLAGILLMPQVREFF